MRRPIPRFVGVLLLGAATLVGSAYAASCPLACALKDLPASRVAASQTLAAKVNPPNGSGHDCTTAPLFAKPDQPALTASLRSGPRVLPATKARLALDLLAELIESTVPRPPGSSRLEPVAPLRT